MTRSPSTRHRDATVAVTLAAVGALVAWLALIADGFSRSRSTVPGWAVALVAVAGVPVAWRWWGSTGLRLRGVRTVQALLLLGLVVALRPSPNHGTGWSPLTVAFGQSLLLVLVVLLPTTTSGEAVVNRVVVAMVATAAVLCDHPLVSAGPRLAVATVLAAATLAATSHSWAGRFPALERDHPDGDRGPGPAPRRTPPLRAGRDAALGALAVLVAVPLLVALEGGVDRPADTGRGPSSNTRASAEGGLSLADELDTSRRSELGDQVVLRVQASVPDFWRAGSYDVWDGRSWFRDTPPVGERRISEVVARGDPWATPTLPTTELQQLVTVVAPTTSMVGAPRLERIEAQGLPMYALRDGSIITGVPMAAGTRYRATSRRVAVTARLLRDHDPRAGSIPAEIRPFLQLPEVPDRVRALASEVAGDAPTTYDAVRALESWMGANTTYTLDIPPLPPDADAVEQHLFVDRAGYCEQIGTSLAVMLRTLGIPARLAVGYAPGDEALLGGEFTVRQRDAHAWVEVWFPGIGWQGFDPTAEVPLAGEYATSVAARLARLAQRVAPAAALVLVAGAVLAGGVAAVRRRRSQVRPGWAGARFADLERAGRRQGRPRAPHETMREYARVLDAGPLAHHHLERTVAVLERARWSGGDVDEAERARVDEQVRLASRRRRRRRDPPSTT